MADQTGLRFDIYERIHLPDDAVGIQELEEIELTPYIRVHSDDEQVVLKGSLQLSGRYIGVEDPGQSQSLQYAIPVEITLPANRGLDMREVGAEIENFDVDVISRKSLNVTGVLSLHGLSLAEQDDDREEMIFVHHAADDAGIAASPAQRNEPAEKKEPAQKQQKPKASPPKPQQSQPDGMEQFAQEQDSQKDFWDEAAWNIPEPKENEAETTEPSADAEPDEGSDVQEQLDPLYDENMENQATDFGPFAQEIESSGKERQPQPDQGVKVAFSGKKLADDGYEPIPLSGGASKQAETKSQGAFAASLEPAGEESSESAEKSGSPDALEWKKLFLSHAQGEQFRKVRMCIIQKEETVDMIAERYQIHPREIMLYNRLDEERLLEGQVVYIPVKQ